MAASGKKKAAVVDTLTGELFDGSTGGTGGDDSLPLAQFAERSYLEYAMSVVMGRALPDVADGQKSCGICDFCAPSQCAAQRFRTATRTEREALVRILAELRTGGTRATGRLHSDLYPGNALVRDTFEEVLGGMARAGLVRMSDASFEKDGRTIPFRKVSLTREGQSFDEGTPIDFVMKDTGKPAKRTRKKPRVVSVPKPAAAVDARVENALRAWRLEEARRRAVPAFRILSDKALKEIAITRPSTADELLDIPGIGMSTVEKYGALICRITGERGETRPRRRTSGETPS